MSFKWVPNGHGHAPAYQVSGLPFINIGNAPALSTNPADTLEVGLDYVSKDITITNTGPTYNLRVAFTARGPISGGPKNYLVVTPGQTVSYNFRCTSIFLMSGNASNQTTFRIIAGLTSIPDSNFPILTGSNGIEGVG